MKRYYTTCLLLILFLPVVAQEQPTLSEAADVHFLRQDYARAAGLYERLLHTRQGRKKAPQIRERLATSYRLYNQYDKAAYWYAKVLEDSTATPEDRLHYGDMLKSLGRYAEAKEQYQKNAAGPRAAARIAGCDSALLWAQQPLPLFLKNEPGLNSSVNDWGTAWYGQELVFVSDSLRDNIWAVKGSRHRYGRNKQAFGKLYAAEKGLAALGYSKNFSSTINNYPYHAGPACFNAAGDTAYVTLTNPDRKVPYLRKEVPVYGTRSLRLMVFAKSGNGWKEHGAFPYNSNDYSVGHASLNKTGNILYFASDRPGGSGGVDIWYCERHADGSWGQPQNCGASINTPDDEAFPMAGNDGHLYFASKGWAGMGGYDVFSTTGSAGNWSAPVNLKPPFSSAGDDFYLILPAANAGFISSNRAGGKGGDDIYSYQHAPELVQVPPNVPLLRIPLDAKVCVTGATCAYLYNKKRNIGWCYMLTPPDGKIEAMLEANTEYVIRVYYPNGVVSHEFNTNNARDGEVLQLSICPPGKR